MRVTIIETIWGDRFSHLKLDATPGLLDACKDLTQPTLVLPVSREEQRAFSARLAEIIQGIEREAFAQGMKFVEQQKQNSL